jgi:hypothetical protein
MQSLGELDPFFVATFFEELGIHWEIFDGKGKQHNVEFNGSPTEPLLISGWGRLRLYYSWTGHQKLCLFYYGRNQFLMVESDNSDHVIPSFFPAFHSFSNFIGKYQTFFMTIGDQDVNSRRVVSINIFFFHINILRYKSNYFITYQIIEQYYKFN